MLPKDKRNTIIYRSFITFLHIIVVGLLTFLSEKIIPFTKNTYNHWQQTDQSIADIKRIIQDNKKENEIVIRQVQQNREAIDFHTSELKNLQDQTNSNTEAIYVMLKK